MFYVYFLRTFVDARLVKKRMRKCQWSRPFTYPQTDPASGSVKQVQLYAAQIPLGLRDLKGPQYNTKFFSTEYRTPERDDSEESLE